AAKKGYPQHSFISMNECGITFSSMPPKSAYRLDHLGAKRIIGRCAESKLKRPKYGSCGWRLLQ
ncbi:hypothetical protein ABTO78_20640, partial [Acinetobacter baumannii]